MQNYHDKVIRNQRFQSAMSAAAVAQSVKTNRTLTEMKAQNGLHTFGIEVLFTPYSLKGGWTGSEEPKKWLDIWGNFFKPNFMK